MQLILQGGNAGFQQRDGAGEGCKEEHQEERHADHTADLHAGKHLGQGDKSQRGACLQVFHGAAREGKHGGNDHKARQHSHAGVENFHLCGAFFNIHILVHIRAVGVQNAHGDGQRVEHLAHGGHHGHNREILKTGHQKILNACQCTGAGDRVDHHKGGQQKQQGHHHLRNALYAVFHACQDHKEHQRREHQKPHLGTGIAADKAAEEAILGHGLAVAAQILHQILQHPAADHAVVGHDQHGDHGIDPAAKAEGGRFAKAGKCAHRAFARHAAHGRFGYDQCKAKGEHEHQIDQKKNAAAVFGRQIGEAPDVAKAHSRACHRQHIADAARKLAAVDFFVMFHSISSCAALVTALCPKALWFWGKADMGRVFCFSLFLHRKIKIKPQPLQRTALHRTMRFGFSEKPCSNRIPCLSLRNNINCQA